MLFGFGITDKIDVGDDDDIGGFEAGGEFIEEETSATMLMGLEDADESAGWFFVGAERSEGGVDFGGVMTVVVVDEDASAGDGAGAQALHPSVNPFEEFEGAGDTVPVGNAQLKCKDGGDGGVGSHVFAGDWCVPLGDDFVLIAQANVVGFGIETDDPIGLG